MGDKIWMSAAEAATALGVSESTVQRWLTRGLGDDMFGQGNWRRKPYTLRTVYQLRRVRIARLALKRDAPEE